MGSHENIVKIEEMKKRVEEGDLLSAQKVLDTMELKKIKNLSDLNLIAKVYSENERYEEAQELYRKIYDKTGTRKSLYQLIEVLLKLNNAEDAQYYAGQYQKAAPEDFYNYVFRYKLDKMKGESFEHLIGILEDLKKAEYTEKWAYELAKLYYKAGMEEECIRECSDIVLWFGEGTYVEKAKILRSYYSGETDKDKIMEEIKHRAQEVSSQESHSGLIPVEESDTAEDQTASEAFYVQEDTLYSGLDFPIPEGSGDFEDGLKKDVQDIMEDGTPEEFSGPEDTYYEEDVLDQDSAASYREEKTYYDGENGIYEDTTAFSREGEETGYTDVTGTASISEEEKAEQEVEQTIYQLLEEENLDEEDKKLKQIAQEFGIDPEEVFGNFLHVLTIKKQLVKSLEIILRERNKNVMVMITGTAGSGKTTLAKDIALFLHQAGKLKSSKVAKIKAEKLNTVNISAKKDTLKDCCLVVEDASELDRQTIENILELSNKLPGEIAIIFEENKKNMNKLFREFPRLMDLMKNRIHLPQYSQEELTGFAYACLKQKDYRMNQKAEQILKNKVGQITKKSEANKYLIQINDLMQSVMDAADIRTGKQLSSLADQGRLKDVEILTILPEDFDIKP